MFLLLVCRFVRSFGFHPFIFSFFFFQKCLHASRPSSFGASVGEFSSLVVVSQRRNRWFRFYVVTHKVTLMSFAAPLLRELKAKRDVQDYKRLQCMLYLDEKAQSIFFIFWCPGNGSSARIAWWLRTKCIPIQYRTVNVYISKNFVKLFALFLLWWFFFFFFSLEGRGLNSVVLLTCILTLCHPHSCTFYFKCLDHHLSCNHANHECVEMRQAEKETKKEKRGTRKRNRRPSSKNKTKIENFKKEEEEEKHDTRSTRDGLLYEYDALSPLTKNLIDDWSIQSADGTEKMCSCYFSIPNNLQGVSYSSQDLEKDEVVIISLSFAVQSTA